MRIAAVVCLMAALSATLTAQSTSRPPIVPPRGPRRPQKVAARPPLSAARYDWRQFNFDSRHTGNNTAESLVSAANVSGLSRLFVVLLPEVADGAPVVLSGVVTPVGTLDLLFVTTKAGRLIALDARTGAPLWFQQPATGPNYTTSSPAIDPDRQHVYAYGLEGAVHKYAVADGTEVIGGGWPETVTLKPDVEKQSSALAIATPSSNHSFLYVANGGYPGDAGDYQGHVTTIDLASGAQNVFNAACSDRTIHFVENGGPDNDCPHLQTAVWARPGVVYDAATNHILFATGNGDFDGHLGGKDWGDSVLAIAPDGTGVSGGPLDSYTPVNFQSLDQTDTDLGSAAPALLPALASSRYPRLCVQAGKDGDLRLLDLDNLSQQGGPGHVGGELQILHLPQGGAVLTQPAVWIDPAGHVWLFVVTASGVSGVEVSVDSSGTPSLMPQWLVSQGGFSPIVANGVLYYAHSNRILALDPLTGNVLWSDTNIGSIHWESPVMANGILYITDESGMLTAYSVNGQLPPL